MININHVNLLAQECIFYHLLNKLISKKIYPSITVL